MIDYIRDNCPRGELLCQLAEEASELAQAALKLRRAEDGTNPTPVTQEQAESELLQEIADVLNILDVLDIGYTDLRFDYANEKKLKRWVERLKEDKKKRERAVEKWENDLDDPPF